MTQVKSAQEKSVEVALRPGRDTRSLAQRRADLQAQIKQMALSDLAQVSARLKGLHKDLERKTGQKWTHYELAAAMKIPPRTFQSWELGEVENRDGRGYEKMARWYSRKLERKITKQWILFGPDHGGETKGEPVAQGTEGDDDRFSQIDQRLDQMEGTLNRVLELLEEREAEQSEADADEDSEAGSQEREPGTGQNG